MNKLWYNQAANDWNEALPLGNGRIGAMIFGGAVCEHIQLNEETVWYGGFEDRNNPDALKNLPQIRKLILDGKIHEAENLMKWSMSGVPQSQRPYQTLGDYYFDFNNISGIENYTRSLDIENAVHTVEFDSNGVHYIRESFISAPENVFVMRFSADRPGMIDFTSMLTRSRFYDRVIKSTNSGVMLEGNLGKGGLDFAMAVRGAAKKGKVEAIGEHLNAFAADEVTLYFTAGTTYRFNDLRTELNRILDNAMSKSYDELKEEHIKDYRSYYDRVSFEIESDEEYGDVPTDIRVKNAAEKKVDKQLIKQYFDYGRYLLISSSRPGTLPATLQGLWNKDMTPPWDSKYTININTEMNYWPAEMCSLPECHMPLFDLIEKMLPNGRVTAKKMYNCRGFVAHHNTDIWGDTAVQDQWIPGSYWVMGAAWLCTHQWMHYEYTKDTEFLKRTFPVMREAAQFFLDFMIEDEGYLKTCPSVSPENTFILPSGERGANTAGVTMDNQILRDLFTQCIEAAKVLDAVYGTNYSGDELDSHIQSARERLVPTQIGKYGQIMEWPKDYDEAEPGHRHVSHLYGLHPSAQITMDKTPELANAAKVTLERRLSHGGGHTGWSRAWIINHYARLWDGEKAYYNLEMLLAKSTLTNLLDNHPPFQIDGNFGAAAGIVEMLMQSTLERIILLPALPAAWNSGSIKGITARGGAVLDIYWKDMQLERVSVYAKTDIETYLIYKNDKRQLKLSKGEKTEFTYGKIR